LTVPNKIIIALVEPANPQTHICKHKELTMAETKQKQNGSKEAHEEQAILHVSQVYNAIITTVMLYWAFADPIIRRAKRKLLFHLLKMDLPGSKGKDVANGIQEKFICKRLLGYAFSDTVLQKAIDEVATNEQKADPLYEVISSDYPIETLCLKIETIFPDYDFTKIEKLNKLNKKSFFQLHYKKMIVAIVFLFITLIPSIIPNSLLEILTPEEPVIGLIVFKLWLYMHMIIILFFLSFIYLLIWLSFLRHPSKFRRRVDETISYLAIRHSGPTGEN
jgi:hypothetical protein